MDMLAHLTSKVFFVLIVVVSFLSSTPRIVTLASVFKFYPVAGPRSLILRTISSNLFCSCFPVEKLECS